MGEVRLVKDLESQIQYALKSPNSRYGQDVEKYLKRFHNEALSWIMLAPHPNVVSCCYADTFDGSPIILLEYVESTNLSQWIIDNKVTSVIKDWRTVLSIFIQIAMGMAHAHSNHYAHLDLTPKNILITKEGSQLRKAGIFAMVTDFGLVKKTIGPQESIKKMFNTMARPIKHQTIIWKMVNLL